MSILPPCRLHRLAAAACCLLLNTVSLSGAIDREALVRRNNPHVTSLADLDFHPPSQGKVDTLHASDQASKPALLQVGNGHFALSVDATGLQSFAPCNTLSDWGWHTAPLPSGRSTTEFPWTKFKNPLGREIPFPWVGLAVDKNYKGSQVTLSSAQAEMAEYLRANPHRLNLGRIAFVFMDKEGQLLGTESLSDLNQSLDQWTGILSSQYKIAGQPMAVLTSVHPTRDLVTVRIQSPLLKAGRLFLRVAFPYGDSRYAAASVGDWDKSEAHSTNNRPLSADTILIERHLDATRYKALLSWSEGAHRASSPAPHVLELRASGASDTADFQIEFLRDLADSGTIVLPTAESARRETAAHWKAFWESGAAIDFSGSADPRAAVLERRIIQSQYLLATQEAGELPPQEAGLYNNGWYGKFHLEMLLWHMAHYALWDRWSMAEGALSFYRKTIPQARELARSQGYEGLRWPKMTGPDGKQSPSSIAPFLIWQQPHPLFFAELDYRAHPTRETLEKWREVVLGTADFMADLPIMNPKTGYMDLAAPLKTAAENTRIEETFNPAFELAYWRFGLRIASHWRQRLGLPRDQKWEKVAAHLAPLPVKQGRYLYSESQPDTYENYPWEHPSLVAMFGLLPGDGADPAIARNTLHAVAEKWNMNRVWGWDFPMLAMTAARVGEPELAVKFLLTDSPNFQFAHNGLATGGPWPYFPSNASLLYAVAFMAGGWDGAPDSATPGFPPSSTGWSIQAEGFKKAP